MSTTAGTSEKQSRTAQSGGSSSVVVVDLGEPQSSVAVKRLTKGKGALYRKVDQIMKDLAADGTVKADAQPVVIVVREYPVPPWFSGDDDDD
jgi:hypothetical protein